MKSFQKNMPSVPSGWLLIDGTVEDTPSEGVLRVRLYGAMESKPSLIELPVLRNGRVHEIVIIPKGTTCLAWEPENVAVEMLRYKRLNLPERIWRMLRRISGTTQRLTPAERAAAGLSFWRTIASIPDTYRQATRMRFPVQYTRWIEHSGFLTAEDRTLIRRDILRFPFRPKLRVLLATSDDARPAAKQTKSSLQRQLYPAAAVSTQSDAHTHQIARSGDEWIIILHPGDQLAEHTLYWIASVICSVPNAGMIYFDDDIIDGNGLRTSPRFKPDWSAELLRSTNYIGNAAAFPSTLFHDSGAAQALAENAGMHDILLRMSERLAYDQIVHIPAVLLHQAVRCQNSPDEGAAVKNHLIRIGKAATVKDTREGCFRIKYALPDPPPFISILIPTRDNLPLLQRCLSSIMEKSTFRNFEIIVIDNRSSDPEVRQFLAHACTIWPVRVIAYDHAFNFSAMNNIAAQHARGTVLCLLNNDTEVISPDWLEEMLGHLMQDRVAVVGAKLFYPDGRVQHAGDVVGAGGIANHLHSCIAADDPGYCMRAIVAQDLSAVTAACMLTWRHIYLSLGGLNEKRLPVAFNDVDYCLRVRRSGYRVIFTPHAHLYHHESVSRGGNCSSSARRQAEREKSFMRREWKNIITQGDPFYNPNLSRHLTDFSPGHIAVVSKPWYSK